MKVESIVFGKHPANTQTKFILGLASVLVIVALMFFVNALSHHKQVTEQFVAYEREKLDAVQQVQELENRALKSKEIIQAVLRENQSNAESMLSQLEKLNWKLIQIESISYSAQGDRISISVLAKDQESAQKLFEELSAIRELRSQLESVTQDENGHLLVQIAINPTVGEQS